MKKILISLSVFFMVFLGGPEKIGAAAVVPTTFDSAASQVAIAAFQTKLQNFNPSTIASALVTLQSQITAASQSAVATNSGLASSISSAQGLYSAVNTKMQAVPSSTNLNALNTAYTNYMAFFGAQQYVSEVAGAQAAVDAVFNGYGSSVIAALSAAQQYFGYVVPGATAPAFLTRAS